MRLEERVAILTERRAAILRSSRLTAQAKKLCDTAVALRHEAMVYRRRQFTVVICGSGTDGAEIAAIRVRVSEGGLPRMTPAKTFYGHGEGRTCCACDRVVGKHEIEVEADFAGALTLRFHSHCFREWQKARDAA